MKVLLVNKFNFIKGGADRYFFDLADLLSARGIEVAKFCMQHPSNVANKWSKYWPSYLNFSKFEWKSAGKYFSRMFYSLEAKQKFEKMIQEFKPDIIHLHNIYYQLSPSILDVAKKYNIPVVMHLHDYKLVCGNYKMFNQGKICEKCKGGKYFHCATNACFRHSFFKSILITIEMYFHHKFLNIYHQNIHTYIAPSEFMRQKMIAWGVPAKKIKTLVHFIDLQKFTPQFQLGNYFLYFGRLSEEKGIDTLLEAIKKIPLAKLKIVGAGPMSNWIKNKIKDLELSEQVELVGPKYNDELKKIIQESLAVVVPSRWYEVFGLVILEAAGLGKAVLGARIGGIPEVIKEQETGLCFNPFSQEDLVDKLNWIIAHHQKVEKMGQNARQHVEQNFTPTQHFKDLMMLYYQALKDKE